MKKEFYIAVGVLTTTWILMVLIPTWCIVEVDAPLGHLPAHSASLGYAPFFSPPETHIKGYGNNIVIDWMALFVQFGIVAMIELIFVKWFARFYSNAHWQELAPKKIQGVVCCALAFAIIGSLVVAKSDIEDCIYFLTRSAKDIGPVWSAHDFIPSGTVLTSQSLMPQPFGEGTYRDPRAIRSREALIGARTVRPVKFNQVFTVDDVSPH